MSRVVLNLSRYERVLIMTWSLGVGGMCKGKSRYNIYFKGKKGSSQGLMPFVPDDLTVIHSLKLSQFKLSFIH